MVFKNLSKSNSKRIVFGIFIGLSRIACGISFNLNELTRPRAERSPRVADPDPGNGERIYFTARNVDGETIRYTGGPGFGGMMMGSYLTCASCHGPGAQGGLHQMHMQVMQAPDIRYQALVGELEEHAEDDHDDEHLDEHAGYSLEDFKRAVVHGEHPDGEPLSDDMPRWQISDRDLEDLFEFLKSIQ